MRKLVLIVVGLLVLAAAAASCGKQEGAGAVAGGGAGADSLGKWRTVLARLDGHEITAEAVYKSVEMGMGPDRAKGTMANPDMLQVATGALLDQFVWAAVAERDGYRLTPGEQAQLDALRAEFLATRYMGDVVQHKADPTPEQVRDWYNQNQSLYLRSGRVGVRHILVATEVEARRVLEEAKSGKDFGALVRQYSLDDKTRDINGALGFVEPGREILGIGKSPAFENAVLPLEAGNMTLVATQRGWHVVRVDRKEGGGLRPLDEVAPEIVTQWRRRNWSTVYNEELSKARVTFHAGMDMDGVERFTGVVQNVDRLWQVASEHPDPAGRIEVYRRISFDFPESKLAPKAQFMIIYLYLTELDDSFSAGKALARLRSRFPDSEWRKAGDHLEQYMSKDQALTSLGHRHEHDGEAERPKLDLPPPEEILKLAGGK